MNHPPHRDQHHNHRQSASHDQQRFLDLDAEVFGDNLKAVLDLAGHTAVRNIVDLGAGTGAGSRLLSDRYPVASVTCVDNDPHMLEVLHQQGFTAVEADLSNGFPALESSIATAATAAVAPVDMIIGNSARPSASTSNQEVDGTEFCCSFLDRLQNSIPVVNAGLNVGHLRRNRRLQLAPDEK